MPVVKKSPTASLASILKTNWTANYFLGLNDVRPKIPLLMRTNFIVADNQPTKYPKKIKAIVSRPGIPFSFHLARKISAQTTKSPML